MNSLKNAQLPGLDTMVLVLAVWLCALPFIGFLVVPVFGISTALGAAFALLLVMLLLCWGRCVSAVMHFYWTEKKTAGGYARPILSLLSDEQHSEKGS